MKPLGALTPLPKRSVPFVPAGSRSFMWLPSVAHLRVAGSKRTTYGAWKGMP
jgi:hypothetical protein